MYLQKNQKIYHVSDPVIIAIAAVGTIIRWINSIFIFQESKTIFPAKLRCVTFLVADNRDNLYIGGFIDLFNFAGMVACRSGYFKIIFFRDKDFSFPQPFNFIICLNFWHFYLGKLLVSA